LKTGSFDIEAVQSWEKVMPPVDLGHMNVEALLALRAEVDAMLDDRARELEEKLALLTNARRPGRPSGRRGTSSLKGVKVAPRYRGPEGETWAGRGAKPKWLAALIDAGHTLEEFAVDDGAAAATGAPSGRATPAKGRRNTRQKTGRKAR
jgi:DNA-binding protein H-NS